jgi:hypothetical protein
VAVAVGAGAASVAWAEISSSGVITACYQKVGGNLRVVDAAAGDECRPSEQALTWNEQGPKGDPGAQGDPGPKGDTGPPGPAGGGFITWSGVTVGGNNVVEVTAPTPLTLSHMYAHVRVAPGVGKKWTVTVRKSPTEVLASCDIADTALACDAAGSPLSYTPGDQVVIVVVPTNAPLAGAAMSVSAA